MAYLVLARKYRSVTFDEVVGQEPIAQTLVNAIKTGRVAHAYLFTGTRGVGKTTMARILAKALNCLAGDEPTTEPCNECEACQAIGRGDDVDVIEIDGASNRGIDEIRELRANAIFRPARCRYKVYYIDEVHMLTKEAFNALLKTLEEPPAHVKFIFATTEIEKVPATIVSRCQRFDFRNISTRRIAEHLKDLCQREEVPAEEEALFRVARAAAGSMRDGLSLLEQMLSGSDRITEQDVIRILGTPPDERMIEIVSAISEGQTGKALGELSAVMDGGVTLASAVEALCEIYRNLMVAASCGPDSDLIELPEMQRQQVGQLSKKFSIPVLVQAVGILQATSRNIRGSSVARALVEAAIVRLAEADKFIDPASLIQRLETIPASGSAAGQKKKIVSLPQAGNQVKPASSQTSTPQATPAEQPSEQADADSGQSTPAPAPKVDVLIQWDVVWLQSNWKTVVDALCKIHPRSAGLIAPAQVTGFSGNSMELTYEARNEGLRQQAEKVARQIDSSLSQLAGQPIRCFHIPSEGVAPGSPPPRAMGGLSSKERAELNEDPAVTAVTSLFGGELIHVQRDELMAFGGTSDLVDEEETVDEEV